MTLQIYREMLKQMESGIKANSFSKERKLFDNVPDCHMTYLIVTPTGTDKSYLAVTT